MSVYKEAKIALADLSKKDVEALAKKRNPDSNADEVRIIIMAILWLVTAYCAYTGFVFYTDTFSKSFTPGQTFIFSIVLATVVEIATVVLGQRVLRAWLFGWANRDWWSFGYWSFGSALFIGAMYWSFNVSTQGQALRAQDRQIAQDTTLGLQAAILEGCKDLDAKIEQAKGVQAEALGNKWKGTTTWNSTNLAKTQADIIEKLEAQRAEREKQISANWQADDKDKRGRMDAFSAWIDKYGGFAEIAKIFALLALAFNDRRVVADNLEQEQKEQTQEQPIRQAAGFTYQQAAPGPITPQPSQNQHAPKFFNRGVDGNVIAAPQNPQEPGKA